MKRLPHLYLGAAAACAAAVAILVVRAGVPDPAAFAVFALLAVGAEAVDVRLPGGASASPLMIPVLAATYVLGGDGAFLAGGLVAGFGGLHPADLRARRLDRVVFNSAQLILAGCGAASIFAAVDPVGHPSMPRFLVATLGAGLVFLVVNLALLAPMMAMIRRCSPRQVVSEFQPLNMQYVPFALVGGGLGFLYSSLGPVVVPFAVAPIVIARATFSSYLAVRRAHDDTLATLVRALEVKHPYTAGHVQRVARYAGYIGEELRLPLPRLERLHYAALMHDVGKLVVAGHLLNKPGRLTADEYARVRAHEAVSVEILQRIDFLRPLADAASPRFARYEERDGGPVEPYVIVVADAYDAMTSTRAYRQALSHEVAVAELRRYAGTQFDPVCVEALVSALERRGERHGAGRDEEEVEEVALFAAPPPLRGPGSASLGDLAPVAAGAPR